MAVGEQEGASDVFARERLLVVGGGADSQEVVNALRRRYADRVVGHAETYLSAIADLSRRGARAVFACASPGPARLGEALAGLRLAVGEDARILLCCPPAGEPLARSLKAEYLILPLHPGEVDRALGIARGAARRRDEGSLADVSALAEVLTGGMGDSGRRLGALAELVRGRLGARGASVVVEGSMSAAGEAVARPVLSAALTREGRIVGQILIGEGAEGPYDAVDARRLEALATIISHLLGAESRVQSWQRQALTDEVSGLPNRRYLRERLPAILAQARAQRFPVTVLLFDVDDFKRYNDAHGHDAGDEIIRVVGQLFRQHCREQDIVARYGGDEFAVAFWDAEGSRVAGSSHPGCALDVLDRFADALRKHPFPRLGEEARLTVSGGLATFPWDGDSAEALIARADQALLAAKRAGKNKVLVIGAGSQPDRS